MSQSKEYKRGYTSAEEVIVKGQKAVDLLNQAKNSLTNDDFDKGWKQCCKDYLP